MISLTDQGPSTAAEGILSEERKGWARPRKLLPTDNVEGFSCGKEELDSWLQRYALVNQRAGMTNVYVSAHEDEIAGFYALSAGGVDPKDAPPRVLRGVARHPVPVIILTRLAVRTELQGQGLGRLLLRDALVRTSRAADEIGVRALLLHAKDPEARSSYMGAAEFEESPTDPLHLMLLMKDLRAALNEN